MEGHDSVEERGLPFGKNQGVADGSPIPHLHAMNAVRLEPAASMDAMFEDSGVEDEPVEMVDGMVVTQGDTLCTPRSESRTTTSAPATAQPHSSTQPQLYHFGSEPEESYFALRHLQNLPAYGTQSTTSTEPSPSHSVNASTTSVDLPNNYTRIISQPLPSLDNQPDRPGILSDRESSSGVSTYFVTDPTTEPRSPRTSTSSPGNNQTTTKRRRDYPVYPDQSFAALQSNFYPPPHLPRPLRTRNSHPSHHTSFSACTSPRPPQEHDNMAPLGSKTAGNTPASSPGLFTPPGSAPLERVISDEGSYSSPFLHFTHKQQPKETHKAEIDRDPISGRKLINQYELVENIGKGSYGKVKLGRELKSSSDPNEKDTVAIKIVGRYSKKRRLGKLGNPEDTVKKEVAILKKARHPHVVALLEVIDDPDLAKVYLILEYVELGEIIWRTEGDKEIARIERRRFERAAQGLEETTIDAEDERLLRNIEEGHRGEERGKVQRHNPDQAREYWSLEHGGGSEDDSHPAKIQTSVIDTVGPAGINSALARQSTALADVTIYDPSHAVVPPFQRLDIGPVDSYNEGDAPSARSSNPSGSVFGGPSAPSSVSALEGSMYGAYASEQPRGRTPSVFDDLAFYTSTEAMNAFEKEYSYVPTLTIQRARQAFRETMLGLEFLHYQGIIHRDIKPANLLWTKEHVVKISDFGVSYLGKPLRENEKGDEVSESDATTLDEAVELAKTVGTPAFYAPELCYTDLTAPRPSVTGQIDVWALGVTLYCILFARVPFLAADDFAMFKLICQAEAVIPRKRLLAIDTSENPQGGIGYTRSSHIREPTELLYEDIDDDLYDLLKRLLVKDPANRITLKEIKYHPWVLHGIKDPEKWLEETDPSRQSHGKRIEVSNEEVAEAVKPLTKIGRMMSNARKALGVIGIGKSRQGRKRAKSGSQSGFTSEEGSTSSPPNTVGKSIRDERRSSLRGDDAITLALKGSRDPSREAEHPLAQSVTASPDTTKEQPFFNAAQPILEGRSEAAATGFLGEPSSSAVLSRPNPPERALSATSTADSTKTVVPYNPHDLLTNTPPLVSPNLPGTPIAVDQAGATSLGAIFHGAGRRLVKKMASKDMRAERRGSSQSPRRAPSVDRVAISHEDARGEPSIALSNTLASGRLNPPQALQNPSLSSSDYYASPTSSHEPEDELSSQNLMPGSKQRLSIATSSPSSSSTGRPTTAPAHERRGSLVTGSNDSAFRSPLPGESSAEAFRSAQVQQERRRQLEFDRSHGRPTSAVTFDTSSFAPLDSCPPSPDDITFFNKQIEDDAHRQRAAQETLLPATYHSLDPSTRVLPVASSSSDDYFTSEVSRPTSVPSVPSMISANSSVMADDFAAKLTTGGFLPQRQQFDQLTTSGQPHKAPQEISALTVEDEAGYNGDGDGAHEEEEDDSDSDEDFLSMPSSRDKSKARSESVSIPEQSRGRARSRTESAHIMKTDESGSSTGTVKKVRRAREDAEGGDDIKRGRTLGT
ncbi:MAG: hypothetical protein M1812_006806 [Candelaria pacifica]|nr:MAG: hypothetical protein M1812_006806 [Candelaria pacifica]